LWIIIGVETSQNWGQKNKNKNKNGHNNSQFVVL
jgi:hypothetical protein